MKGKLSQNIFTLLLVFFIAVIIIFVGVSRTTDIRTDSDSRVELNSAEREYVSKHKTVTISLDRDLMYLYEGSSKGSYLRECTETILKPGGLTPVFVGEDEKADCELRIITPHLREEREGAAYTAPMFQVEGAMFLNSKGRDKYAGYGVKNHITPEKLEKVKLDSEEIDCTFAGDNITAAEKTLSEGKGFVIGDVDAIHAVEKYRRLLLQQEEILYKRNVCFIVPPGEDTLYSILNTCIQEADRHELTYELAEKWFDGNAPVYMKNDNSRFYFLIVIIFTAVVGAFFIYYMADRNMYRELSVRMNELVESRRELQTTFNGVGYLLAELDPEGKILDVNKAFEEYSGGSTGVEIWNALDIEGDAAGKLRSMTERTSKGQAVENLEANMGNGIFSIDVFPIEGAHRQIEKLLFVGMDITGERMAERQMLQDNKMIAIGQLAAGVAHEIRNPLGLIRNYCYVLKNFKDEKVREDAVEQIEKAVETSNGIITNLLGFSRDSGRYRQRVNVRDVIESILLMVRKSARAENIEMRVSCDENLETVTVLESLSMILINLIQNASDAIEEQGVIEISAWKSEEKVMISVRDTGCGIAPEALEEIYNPFYTTKGTNGTGLGLYIVYNEVEKLNGDIRVTSRQEEGTEFTLILPVMGEAEENTHG